MLPKIISLRSMQQLRRGNRLPVDAFDRAQQKKISSGRLLTLDNQIDTTTGTIKLKAIFPNADLALFPNQFVNARLLVNTQRGVTLVPTAAIQRNAQGAFVFVVHPDQTVAMQTVSVGTTDGNVTAVEGVNAGDTIAVDGFDKLQDGVKVVVRNTPGNGSGRANPVSPSRPFILRPVATSLLMAAILLAGIVAYRQLPVSALPEVDYPTIQVITFYPGASPDVMATAVTAPLERQFGQVPGLNQMTSTSSGGSSIITLQFST